jgi:hypothetical protein
MADLENHPTDRIKKFADWAVKPDQKAFRVAAATDLKDAIEKAPTAPPLDAAEEQFCEGWIYLARFEIGADNPNLDDELVKRAKAQIDKDQMTTMNG